MHTILISYSTKNLDDMLLIYRHLRMIGFTVWIDKLGIAGHTKSWLDEIEKALKDTQCVIGLMSPDAKASDWVKEELYWASELNKNIYLILLDSDTQNSIPFGFGRHQRFNIHDKVSQTEKLEYLDNSLVKSIIKELSVTPKPLSSIEIQKLDAEIDDIRNLAPNLLRNQSAPKGLLMHIPKPIVPSNPILMLFALIFVIIVISVTTSFLSQNNIVDASGNSGNSFTTVNGDINIQQSVPSAIATSTPNTSTEGGASNTATQLPQNQQSSEISITPTAIALMPSDITSVVPHISLTFNTDWIMIRILNETQVSLDGLALASIKNESDDKNYPAKDFDIFNTFPLAFPNKCYIYESENRTQKIDVDDCYDTPEYTTVNPIFWLDGKELVQIVVYWDNEPITACTSGVADGCTDIALQLPQTTQVAPLQTPVTQECSTTDTTICIPSGRYDVPVKQNDGTILIESIVIETPFLLDVAPVTIIAYNDFIQDKELIDWPSIEENGLMPGNGYADISHFYAYYYCSLNNKSLPSPNQLMVASLPQFAIFESVAVSLMGSYTEWTSETRPDDKAIAVIWESGVIRQSEPFSTQRGNMFVYFRCASQS